MRAALLQYAEDILPTDPVFHERQARNAGNWPSPCSPTDVAEVGSEAGGIYGLPLCYRNELANGKAASPVPPLQLFPP